MRYFTPSLLVAVLAPLAVSAVPTRRDTDPGAGQVPQLALTSTAGGATRTALPLYARDSDLDLIGRDVIVAQQGAAVSFGQPDANGNVPVDISTPDPTTPPITPPGAEKRDLGPFVGSGSHSGSR
ncbi:hypothetical protein BJV74DRAFT_864859 [Russula compacta]|nr:hypothetical protein BJV74DRAFT_864840 [Russula compacta]KAH9972670.1 hypothetical protein BJV74DRAFT_864859 [Russula compacta]